MTNVEYIIVTGASGFVGRNLINKLSYTKNKKFIFIYKSKKPIIFNKKLKNYILLKLDLTKKNNFKMLPKNNVTFFYHLAADPKTFLSKDFINSQFTTNTMMAMNIAEYCDSTNVKYLFFASSVYVYSGINKKKYKISDKTYPQEILGTSKLSSELILKSWSAFINTKIIILRFFTIYGQGANKNQFIPSTVQKIKNSKISITFIKNSITRDFIHIFDVIEIILKLSKKIESFKDKFIILNIGNGKKIKVLSVIKYLLKIINPQLKIKLLAQKRKTIGDNSHCADISELKKIIDYEPKISIQDGLKKLI